MEQLIASWRRSFGSVGPISELESILTPGANRAGDWGMVYCLLRANATWIVSGQLAFKRNRPGHGNPGRFA